jgi:hypothetical protein
LTQEIPVEVIGVVRGIPSRIRDAANSPLVVATVGRDMR